MIKKTPPLEIYWEEAENQNSENENEEVEMKVYEDVGDDEVKVEEEGFKEEACTSKSSKLQQL
jgi:hypothetical protein